MKAGIRFDFSKTHLDRPALDAFVALADAAGLDARRDALFAGEIVNPTEGRAAEHTAERGEGAPESVARARRFHARMRTLVDAIEAEAFGAVRHILHIGIGGSALGPEAARRRARPPCRPLRRCRRLQCRRRCARGSDPPLRSPRHLAGDRVQDLHHQRDHAQRRLGACMDGRAWRRRSLWPGRRAHRQPGKGGRIRRRRDPHPALRRHRRRPLSRSGPRSAFPPLWRWAGTPSKACSKARRRWTAISASRRSRPTCRCSPPSSIATTPMSAGAETRAVFAYDERLRLLPSYLQQLEMESNGKSVRLDGAPVGRATAPIVWGGVGTEAQHAVFQLLHQGTHLVPVEFVAAIEPGDTLRPDHHRQLLINCFAQGAALMAGRPADDPHRSYPGDRPSTTILLDRVDPARPRRADRLLRASRFRQCRSARHQPVRPVRRRARQGDGEGARPRRRSRAGFRPVDQGTDRARTW